MSYTADIEKTEREPNSIFRLFFDTKPLSFQNVNTSHGKEDFREVVIAKYGGLPTSVFQAALIRAIYKLDESGRFAGVYDFTL